MEKKLTCVFRSSEGDLKYVSKKSRNNALHTKKMPFSLAPMPSDEFNMENMSPESENTNSSDIVPYVDLKKNVKRVSLGVNANKRINLSSKFLRA